MLFVFRLVLSRGGKGYATVLAELWEQCRKLGIALPQPQPVAASSIAKARARVSDDLFLDLHREILRHGESGGRWNGHRLFARVVSHYISTRISRIISARGEDSFPLCSVFLETARRRRRPVAARILPMRTLRSGTAGTFLPSTRARPAGAGRSSRTRQTVPPLPQKPV